MHIAIVLAAGKSRRMGPHVDKAFLSVASKPVLSYSLAALDRCSAIDGIIVVVRRDRIEGARHLARVYGFAKVRHVVAGGAHRWQSLANGLAALDIDVSMVTVHDACRPCVTLDLIEETIKVAHRHGAAASAVNLNGPVVEVGARAAVLRSFDADGLWEIQTPRTYSRELLESACAKMRSGELKVKDDYLACLDLGAAVRLVAAPPTNVNISTSDDLPLVTALLND